MEYGKRSHYDMALDQVTTGVWKVEPETGLIFGRGRSLDQWHPIGVLRAGYVRVRVGYKGPSVTAHRVIYEVVHGRSDLLLTINHKNGDKSDNRISNLELLTNAKNVQHAHDNGMTHPRDCRGEKNNLAKLTADQVREIRRLSATGVRGRDLAARFNTSEQNISCILHRRNWRHVA